MKANKLDSKIILHRDFKSVVNQISKIKIRPISHPVSSEVDFSKSVFPINGKISSLEPLGKIRLNCDLGQKQIGEYNICGYDESKLLFRALEGQAHLTTHSLVYVSESDFEPINYISYYFYTKSSIISYVNPYLTYTDDPIAKSNFDYVMDRNYFLNNWSPINSILFIDGPLIGGNISKYTIDLVKNLQDKDIIPIFFVKNSDSDLVSQNLSNLKNRYNNDLHWSFDFLNLGERTNLFLYSDEYNPKQNAKVFCYLKPFNISPQRIEFHITTYYRYKDYLDDIFNLIYYLLIVQGDVKNPQIRPIAVAEKYARDIMSISDNYTQVKYAGLTPIMNQVRFN